MPVPPDDQLAELGRVVTLAALLEWDLAVLIAQLTPLSEDESMELLKHRPSLIRKLKESVEEFEQKVDKFRGKVGKREASEHRFLLHDKFIADVESAFAERDRVAHGIYLLGNGKFVMFHPRSREAFELNVKELNEISTKIDMLSVTTFSMVATINSRKSEMLITDPTFDGSISVPKKEESIGN